MVTLMVLAAVLLLALGILLGSSWTQQALQRRYRDYAAERRALNEQWQAMRELRAELDEHNRRAARGNDDVVPPQIPAMRRPHRR